MWPAAKFSSVLGLFGLRSSTHVLNLAVNSSNNVALELGKRCLSGPNNSIFGKINSFRFEKGRKKTPKKDSFPDKAFLDKPTQEWWDWDGFGRYKFRSHHLPNNWSLQDFQRRRILGKFAEDRLRLNIVRKADILPTEIRAIAHEEIQKVPRDSAITRVNRRCSVTGRARGIFHQFRVSRFVFRKEADYNKVSGVQRAHWMRTVHIKP